MTNPLPKQASPGEVPKRFRVFNEKDIDAAQRAIATLMGPRAPIYTERLQIVEAVINAATESAKRDGRTQRITGQNLTTKETWPFVAFQMSEKRRLN